MAQKRLDGGQTGNAMERRKGEGLLLFGMMFVFLVVCHPARCICPI